MVRAGRFDDQTASLVEELAAGLAPELRPVLEDGVATLPADELLAFRRNLGSFRASEADRARAFLETSQRFSAEQRNTWREIVAGLDAASVRALPLATKGLDDASVRSLRATLDECGDPTAALEGLARVPEALRVERARTLGRAPVGVVRDWAFTMGLETSGVNNRLVAAIPPKVLAAAAPFVQHSVPRTPYLWALTVLSRSPELESMRSGRDPWVLASAAGRIATAAPKAKPHEMLDRAPSAVAEAQASFDAAFEHLDERRTRAAAERFAEVWDVLELEARVAVVEGLADVHHEAARALAWRLAHQAPEERTGSTTLGALCVSHGLEPVVELDRRWPAGMRHSAPSARAWVGIAARLDPGDRNEAFSALVAERRNVAFLPRLLAQVAAEDRTGEGLAATIRAFSRLPVPAKKWLANQLGPKPVQTPGWIDRMVAGTARAAPEVIAGLDPQILRGVRVSDPAALDAIAARPSMLEAPDGLRTACNSRAMDWGDPARAEALVRALDALGHGTRIETAKWLLPLARRCDGEALQGWIAIATDPAITDTQLERLRSARGRNHVRDIAASLAAGNRGGGADDGIVRGL